ncbi:MAG TPA: hypothetical protein VFQ35_23440 [Polyangiaceae bacterium]|nr:hypothetical protein [Polyangiaceae bacterium]
MPGWFVAVELPTRDTTQQESAALISACSAALGRGKCALSEAAESAPAVAVVSFRGAERLRALVEVGRRETESRSWRSQEIAFRPEDARLERFRTLGLAIATLVRESKIEPVPPPEGVASFPEEKKPQDIPKETPPTPPPKAAPEKPLAREVSRTEVARPAPAPPLPTKREPPVWLSVGALGAYDHELPSSMRYGGRIGVGVTRVGLPLYASLTGAYSVGAAPGDEQAVSRVSLAWATIAAGFGARMRLPFDTEGRAAIQGVLVDLTAHAAASGDVEEEGQRWILGGQLELELAALRSRTFGFTLGGAAQHLTGATALVVHRDRVATSAAFTWSVHAALELHLFR